MGCLGLPWVALGCLELPWKSALDLKTPHLMCTLTQPLTHLYFQASTLRPTWPMTKLLTRPATCILLLTCRRAWGLPRRTHSVNMCSHYASVSHAPRPMHLGLLCPMRPCVSHAPRPFVWAWTAQNGWPVARGSWPVPKGCHAVPEVK